MLKPQLQAENFGLELGSGDLLLDGSAWSTQSRRNHFNIKKRRYWHCRTQIQDVWDMLVWGALRKKHEFYIILASLRHWMQCLAGTCYLKHVKTSVCKLRILDSNSEVEICFWMDLLGQHSRNHFNIKKRRYWHCRTQIQDVWDMLVWGALAKETWILHNTCIATALNAMPGRHMLLETC